MSVIAQQQLLTDLHNYLDAIDDKLDELADEFNRNGMVELKDFAPEAVRGEIRAEVLQLLDTSARRRDLTIAITGNTPRKFESINRDAIVEGSNLIPLVYRSPELMRVLAKIAREPEVVPIPHPPEEVLITRLTQVGDTHGWHWDDYSFSLVWMIEAPAAGDGGAIEWIPGTAWDKENPNVDEVIATHEVRSCNPLPGSAFLLKTDTSLHRVGPLAREGVVRIVLVFGYATLADLEKDVTHETVSDIY